MLLMMMKKNTFPVVRKRWHSQTDQLARFSQSSRSSTQIRKRRNNITNPKTHHRKKRNNNNNNTHSRDYNIYVYIWNDVFFLRLLALCARVTAMLNCKFVWAISLLLYQWLLMLMLLLLACCVFATALVTAASAANVWWYCSWMTFFLSLSLSASMCVCFWL